LRRAHHNNCIEAQWWARFAWPTLRLQYERAPGS
jgi:hypothetical protein